jgi:hypothetical protein
MAMVIKIGAALTSEEMITIAITERMTARIGARNRGGAKGDE